MSRGFPHYVDIPGEVNMYEILRLWTYARGLDLIGWGRMRYNLLGQGDHWFPGENAGGVRKLNGSSREALLRSVAASPFAERIPGLLAEAHDLLFEKPMERRAELRLKTRWSNMCAQSRECTRYSESRYA